MNYTKYQNKYRIPPARLENWNYGAAGSYFITICTKNRNHYFGEIVETRCIASELVETDGNPSEHVKTDGNPSLQQMQLTELGKMAETEWLKTIEMRPDMNLEMGEFIVMPNHFHAIIIIGDNEFNTAAAAGNTFGSQSKNLASIVRGFKSAMTTHARKMGNPDFGWQERYHDHIIRNSDSFERIQHYIANNPAKWNDDKFNNHNHPK